MAPGRLRPRLGAALTALVALTAMGCFRASGIQRTTVTSEAVPETGGDRVGGLKSTAGPGDYYLGNDFIQITVDGTRFGDSAQTPIAGALGGGSIVDAGYLSLDTSYQRVNVPGDSLERLTPVVNQDPGLQIVIDAYNPDTHTDPATLTMTGGIMDPGHRIPGATWDASGRVKGVTVQHVISLGKLDRFFTLKTTVTNASGAQVGVRSIGDSLVQSGGGYQLAIPAGVDIFGRPLPKNWGVEIPGSDFGSPIATAVQAPCVVMMATEPGAATVDSHASLGIMPLDRQALAVTSDPQTRLTALRPLFPKRMVAGSLPIAPDGLASGGALSYSRRLYVAGGSSSSSDTPVHGTSLYNQIAAAKFNKTDGIWPLDTGQLTFTLSGSARMQGPLPTQVLVERQAGVTAGGQALWIPERAEFLEPGENITSQTGLASSSINCILPVGTYRLKVTNALGEQTVTSAVNQADSLGSQIPRPLFIQSGMIFLVGGTDYICPEADQVVTPSGAVVTSFYSIHDFTTRKANAPEGSLEPLRVTFKGLDGTPDPWVKRTRTAGTYFSSILNAVAIATSPGRTEIRAGNEMFGSAFATYLQTQYFWFPNGTLTGALTQEGNPAVQGGSYRGYGSRGPLSRLTTVDVLAYDGQSDTTHTLVTWPVTLPSGWTSFDVPGPSQATTGGYLPWEKLASALAEGVGVVAHTEEDLGTDANRLYNDFKWEFNASGLETQYLASIGEEPYVVGARTSVLPGWGPVTSLFTPTATRYRHQGAIQPRNWTLADFMTQAKGTYTIVHQPRGASGLFTLKGFDRAMPVGQGANAWWNGTGPYAQGLLNGGFDALELLRGEGFDKDNPGPWFNQFLQVRSDWFALLNQQTPTRFTKALGLSYAKFSVDTPVGLARTWIKASPKLTNPPVPTEAPTADLKQDLSSVLTALQSGAAVASTGPMLDVTIGGKGPGSLVAGPLATANVQVDLYKSDWMPLDEVRIVMNGQVVGTHRMAEFTADASNPLHFTATFPVTLPTSGTGAWIVVEAGVPLTQTGPYAAGTPWAWIMRGIYPIAVTNPIFIDVTGHGYTHP
ncbi:MAG TPA: hypothetical protein VK188_03130 [Holophaga sp.]|nr:hypothetical protein [Holophaga sp.]